MTSRKCEADSWDNSGSAFPVLLIDGTSGHRFCPAKVFRDDPATILYFEQLFVAWKTGIPLSSAFSDNMDHEMLTDLAHVIKLWENLEYNQRLKDLGRLIGGDEKPKGGK